MSLYIYLLDHASQQPRLLSLAKKNGLSQMMHTWLPEGQCLLFCCFSHILILHSLSFVWRSRVHGLQSTSLLEHILHYYFIMAGLLLWVSSSIHKSEKVNKIIATQLSLYFLWHILHRCKETKNLSLFKKKTLATLFPMFIESFAWCFVLIILPFFWMTQGHPSQATDALFTQLLHLNSYWVLCDLASLAFRCLEILVYPCLT